MPFLIPLLRKTRRNDYFYRIPPKKMGISPNKICLWKIGISPNKICLWKIGV